MTNVPQTVTVNIQLSFWVNSQANIKFKILRIHLISKIKDGYHHHRHQTGSKHFKILYNNSHSISVTDSKTQTSSTSHLESDRSKEV